ncbi:MULTISPECIES: transposase [unclassified Enterococcus]|uniref:transposase n=1 Tax=unclassified Enterococcus TaxID=2608891 RepID=UPI00259BAD52|nr:MULTISPECIES: transposase [unclassified Enterococcus]MDO0919884.1 helix-turn-helix domain-containing protein [Enterococcus sp. B1E2]WIV14314.1 helix-turn-helix domain-containing protein [Enterococcus sp. FZMF]
MAIGKYKKWLEQENLILLEGWARDGLTDEQIAQRMGISTTTLYRWKSEHREIREAIKKGKEVVDFEVENALLRNARKGDTTAQIFWLKNRRPDKWRDSRDRTDRQDKLMAAQLQKEEMQAKKTEVEIKLAEAKLEKIKNGTTQTTEDKLDELLEKISGELND